MKRIIKGLIIITIAVIALTACRPSKALAATRYRYTTQTVNLKNRVKGHTVHKVKRNTRVRLIKTGKRWAVWEDGSLPRYINFKGSNADVFLLKDGKRIPYSEVV